MSLTFRIGTEAVTAIKAIDNCLSSTVVCNPDCCGIEANPLSAKADLLHVETDRNNRCVLASEIEEFFGTAKSYKSFNPKCIKNVEFYPPAVKMTFTDGTVTTAVAQEGDEYNPEVGMMVCIMKYIWKGNSFNTEFRKWIKADEKKKADKLAAKLAKEKEKADKAKKIAKAQERRRRYEEKQIEMQKEAYLRAMKEANARASE